MNETKEHILKTTLVLFLQKSYKDVTMSEIVKMTGLSKGAFYHYFTSKEALFKEIVTIFMAMGGAAYSAFDNTSLKTFYNQYIESITTSIENLNNLVANSERKSANFNFFFILFEAVSRFPEFLEMELEMHKKDINAWTNVISAARKSGEIKSQSGDEEIADLFLYSADGVFLRFINNDNRKSFKEYLSNAFDTIYNNIKI